MKKCNTCHTLQLLSAFKNHAHTTDNHYPQCKTCDKIYQVAYRIKNKAKIVKKRAEVYLLKREAKIKATLDWQKANRGATNAKNRAYKASKKQRMPKWLTTGDKIEMKWAYDIAISRSIESGISHEVDHIVPLQGENVSGLHVPWNLQVITGEQNNKKNNKFEDLNG